MLTVARAIAHERPHGLPHRLGYEILDGEYAGLRFCAYDEPPIGAECRVMFEPADQFARSVDDGQIAGFVIARLARRTPPIDATWEYPGYLCIRLPDGTEFTYGRDGAGWYGSHVKNGGEEQIGDVDELPETAGPDAIADLLATAYAQAVAS